MKTHIPVSDSKGVDDRLFYGEGQVLSKWRREDFRSKTRDYHCFIDSQSTRFTKATQYVLTQTQRSPKHEFKEFIINDKLMVNDELFKFLRDETFFGRVMNRVP